MITAKYELFVDTGQRHTNKRHLHYRMRDITIEYWPLQHQYAVIKQEHITSDLRNVTCPVLEVNSGRLECGVAAGRLSCTYHCPSGYFYETNGTMKTSAIISCDSSTAQWSHMSASNPMGDLPKCAGACSHDSLLSIINLWRHNIKIHRNCYCTSRSSSWSCNTIFLYIISLYSYSRRTDH